MRQQSSQPSKADRALHNAEHELDDDGRTLILDHSRHPRQFGTLANVNRTGKAENPVCGDRYQVFLNVIAGRIEAIRFRGTGCAISMASASMMTDAVERRPVIEAELRTEDFHKLLAGDASAGSNDALGDLAALAGVRAFPLRIKCVLLPWQALLAAIRNDQNRVVID